MKLTQKRKSRSVPGAERVVTLGTTDRPPGVSPRCLWWDEGSRESQALKDQESSGDARHY